MQEIVLDADIGMNWVDHIIGDHLNKIQFSFKDAGIHWSVRTLTLDSEFLHNSIWKPDIFIGKA